MKFHWSLKLEAKGMNPKAKYFLIRILDLYGERFTLEDSTSSLSRKLGITDRQVSAALQSLVSVGYLQPKQGSSGRGRSRNHFMPTGKLVSALAEAHQKCQSHFHENLLDDLFLQPYPTKEKMQASNIGMSRKPMVHSKKHPSLNISCRVLLMTLLYHANEGGLVDSLGQEDLAKLTGLKIPALLQQLKHLSEEGYIRYSESGFSRKSLFGRVKTVYYLHIGHPAFEKAVTNSCMLLYFPMLTSTNGFRNLAKHIERLCNGLNSSNLGTIKYSDIDCTFDLGDLVRQAEGMFKELKWDKEIIYFQGRLECLASEILTSCFVQISDVDFKVSQLTETELAITRRHFQLNTGRSEELTAEQMLKFFHSVFSLAFFIAFRAKKILLKYFVESDIQNSGFIINPMTGMKDSEFPDSAMAITVISRGNYKFENPYLVAFDKNKVYLDEQQAEPLLSKCGFFTGSSFFKQQHGMTVNNVEPSQGTQQLQNKSIRDYLGQMFERNPDAQSEILP